MNRRNLLLLVTALAGSGMSLRSADTAELLPVRMLFGDPEMVAVVGRYCNTLMTTDTATLWAKSGLLLADTNELEQLASAFAAKRKADFLEGRIVTVGGWLMAESECAICMLLAAS